MASRKCQRCAEGIRHTFTHGTQWSYAFHGCRCEACRDKANSHTREWRTDNSEYRRAARAYMKAWRERHADYIAAYSGRYRAENRDQRNARNREWAARNRTYDKARYTSRRSREKTIVSPRRYSRWTPAEDAIACRHDLTAVEIAYMLGRSVKAVHHRRGYLTELANA